MIALTGDTRGAGAIRRLSRSDTIRSMSKNDFLIILGNCGITEAGTDIQGNIGMYRDLPCSVAFLDGPSDDYDFLSEHPPFPWNGGMIQNISRHILRLMRGQVFSVGGRRILTVGGGTAPGRDDFGKYHTWWPEQDISPEDIDAAVGNLRAVGGRVDCVLSYDFPASWKQSADGSETVCQTALESVLEHTEYGHWYFSGHTYADLPEHRATAVGQEIVPLG